MFTPVLLLPFLIVLVKSYPFPNDIEFFCSIYTFRYKRQNTFLGQTNYANIWRFLCQGLTHPRLHLRKSGGMLVLFAPDQCQGYDSPLHKQVICFDEDPKLFSPIHSILRENFGLWTISMIFLNCFISRWRSWLESPGVKGFLDGNGRVRTTLQIGVIICWTCFS